MPLVKSPSNAARSENIRREIDAGRPPKQAEAIAYSLQRRAKARRAERNRNQIERGDIGSRALRDNPEADYLEADVDDAARRRRERGE